MKKSGSSEQEPYKHPEIQIGNTDLPLLKWIQKRTGGSVCLHTQAMTKKPGAHNKKALYVLMLSCRKAYIVAKNIRKYMHGTKEQIIEDIIDFYEMNDPGKWGAQVFLKKVGIIG